VRYEKSQRSVTGHDAPQALYPALPRSIVEMMTGQDEDEREWIDLPSFLVNVADESYDDKV